MDILQTYHNAFDKENASHDFTLVKYLEKLFVGKDAEGNVAVVIISNKPNRKPSKQKTKMLSVEFNSAVAILPNSHPDTHLTTSRLELASAVTLVFCESVKLWPFA